MYEMKDPEVRVKEVSPVMEEGLRVRVADGAVPTWGVCPLDSGSWV